MFFFPVLKSEINSLLFLSAIFEISTDIQKLSRVEIATVSVQSDVESLVSRIKGCNIRC